MSSWLDVGGIISDYSCYPFNKIKLRPLVIGDLNTLHNAKRHQSVQTLVNMMQDHVDIDVEQLRVLDFKYLMHWMKQKSFPENSMTVTWRCTNTVIHQAGFPDRLTEDAPELEYLNSLRLQQIGYERSCCERLNTEIVYQVRTRTKQIEDSFNLPKGYKFPLVRDLIEAEDLIENSSYKHLVPYLMWIDSDSLKDAIEDVDWFDEIDAITDNIERFKKLGYGTHIVYSLKCSKCDKVFNIDKDLDIFDILPAVDQTQIMDIQYNLFGQFQGAVLDEDTPTMKLFYWHSCLVKDKQKQEEERLRQSASSRTAMSPSLKKSYGKR